MSVINHSAKDVVGQSSGRLTVLGLAGKNKHGHNLLECRCTCDNIKITPVSDFLKGKVTSCGCLKNQDYKKVNPDKTGMKFGVLTVLRKAEKHELPIDTQEDCSFWVCECDCGNEVILSRRHLTPRRRGCSNCCSQSRTELSTTHGLRDTSLYDVWRDIRYRCLDPNNKHYPDYGGRGITLCDEWRTDLKTFYDWAMSNGWKQGLSVERKDNNGPYESWNCKLATAEEQANNRRSNVIVVIEGNSYTLAQAVRLFGKVSYSTAATRIYRGWNPVEAITTPLLRGVAIDEI